jgi:MFS family permease
MAPFQALGPAIGEAAYDEAAVFGLVSALAGAGSVVGSILAVRWRPQRLMLAAMLVTMPWTSGYIAYALGAPLPLLGVVAFGGGIGIGLFMIWWESTLAREIPPAALSRVSAFDWMGSLGLLPLGLILAGPIGEAIGLRETLIAGCALTLVVDLLVVGTRTIREFRPASALERA